MYPNAPSCPCNTFTVTPSGEAICKGSATVTVTPNRYYQTGSGGAVCSGHAIDNVSTQMWADFKQFLPLQETSTGASGEFKDITGNGNNGTGGGADASSLPVLTTNGVCCEDAQQFGGRAFISTPGFQVPVFTVSCFVYLTSYFSERCFYSIGSAFTFGHNFLAQTRATITLNVNGTSTAYTATGSTKLQKNKWYRVSAVCDGQTLKVYINGSLDGSVTLPAYPVVSDTSGNLVGKYANGQFFVGEMEEVSFASEARDAAWLLAEYDSYCASFYTVT